MFQKFLIRNTSQFIPSDFPQLEESLREVVAQLARKWEGPKADMILSFVKDHSLPSQEVEDYPELAKLISTGSLPLYVMESLFESSRQHPLFRKQLEHYIKEYFRTQNL